MKKLFLLFVATTLCFVSIAQTQQGYVKTKGRMVDGKLVPGQGLKGATVSVKGRTTILVNTDDGAFSFPVTETQFRLDSVRKKGYKLIDMDVYSKTYNHSTNPLYLVMETPEQQLQDQLAAERKIRRTLTKHLQEQEDEIEALKEQQKITNEEYSQALQKLYEDTDQNEQLVKDMAKRYSELDYDQLDEFYRNVSFYIENGELMKADSVLNTKGDVTQQVGEQLRKGQAIKEQEEQLSHAKSVYSVDLDELAKRCYSYYETFAAQHMNDTAAYYLELRASLDTTNVEWLLDAGVFIREYLSDYEKAMVYHQQALRQTHEGKDEQNYWKSLCLFKLGLLYTTLGDYEKSLECYQNALTIQKKQLGENHRDVAQTLNYISSVYIAKGDFYKALEYSKQTLSMLTLLDENDPEIANSYNLMAIAYMELDGIDMAINQWIKSLGIVKRVNGEIHPSVASIYNNIGYGHDSKGDYHKAIENYQKSLAINTTLFGEKHPDIAGNYDNIGVAYYNLGDLNQAILYNTKALNVRESIFTKSHPKVALSYNNMGFIYNEQKDYSRALDYFNKALSAFLIVFGEDHPKTIQIKDKISEIQAKLKEQKDD